jgi:hypothetical protein
MAYLNRGRKSPRHAFLFQVGTQKPVKVYAKVKPARAAVEIVLTEEHIKRALKLDGRGDAQNCAGAVCVKSHPDAFPHGFSGHVDWLHHRAYVADSNTSIGLPKTCVAYRLKGTARRVAPMFDSKDGLRQLLKLVRGEGGKLKLVLEPPAYTEREAGRAKGGKDAPPRRKVGAQGHALRLTKIGAGAAWFKEMAKGVASASV